MAVHLQAGTLEVTPTWIVALVCFIFVLISLILERSIHHVGKWLSKHKQTELSRALEKMKEELMLVGFISLLITVFQNPLAKICMPPDLLNHMLPCKISREQLQQLKPKQAGHSLRRNLAGAVSSKCANQGKVPFIATEGIHQLHIFIFVLAVTHVVYTCLTILIGRWKIHTWKAWESAASKDTLSSLKRMSTFVQTHAESSSFLAWIMCFFHHFGESVTKSDYLTLRHGFIMEHNLDKNYNFHSYILRGLEDDFNKVVGISTKLWFFVILFLLINAYGGYVYFWISFLPLLMILVIGTKLQHIIVTLAKGIAQQRENTENAAVKPQDELFWFNRPKLILSCIHFAIFQNAFDIALFFWIWASFGFDSCLMEGLIFTIIRLVTSCAIVLILCSYTTLPLYALVTQMGSRFTGAIFHKDVKESIIGWGQKIRDQNTKKQAAITASPTSPEIEMEMQESSRA